MIFKLKKKYLSILCVVLMFSSRALFAQGEHTASLKNNPLLTQQHWVNVPMHTTILSLPFFDDFASKSVKPNEELWQDNQVWINNNMAKDEVTQGVATFDALNSQGVPYDTTDLYNTIYADSLTSLPIDLSTYSPSDSLYLSFLYQPQGNGFAPKQNDSLMLYIHTSNGEWLNVWSVSGESLDSFMSGGKPAFQQVMIPINLPIYFYSDFQFRFVNKATIGISNSIWNVDYIKLDANRNQFDTAINDVAFTLPPPSMLIDFTAMPYKHFITQPTTFLQPTISCTFRNNNNNPGLVKYFYTASYDDGIVFSTDTGGIGGITPSTSVSPTFPMYNLSPVSNIFSITNKYALTDIYANAQNNNDTIIQKQDFTNYFAYDDGSAEQSYFLSLAQNVPGKIAIENKMYVPDTLRGVAMMLAQQVPLANQKYFSLAVYKSLAGINGSNIDSVIYQQDYYYPQYSNNSNELTVYKFDQPVVMDTGVYYIALLLPANGPSDSLMIALDVNRTQANHRYYSVYNQWQPSLLQGALMIRPLVGAALPVKIEAPALPNIQWALYPNPTENMLNITSDDKGLFKYSIYDIAGKKVQSGILNKQHTIINIASLHSGTYFFYIIDSKGKIGTKKFNKL